MEVLCGMGTYPMDRQKVRTVFWPVRSWRILAPASDMLQGRQALVECCAVIGHVIAHDIY